VRHSCSSAWAYHQVSSRAQCKEKRILRHPAICWGCLTASAAPAGYYSSLISTECAVCRCAYCLKRGATIGCRVERCTHSFHLHCARGAGCTFYPTKHIIACAAHAPAFQHEAEKDRQDPGYPSHATCQNPIWVTLHDLLFMLKKRACSNAESWKAMLVGEALHNSERSGMPCV
jgi:hypothetical protein